MCTPLKLEKKFLLPRNKAVRARKLELLILGQPKANTQGIWQQHWPEGSDCCPTAPSPATSLSTHPAEELQEEILGNQNEKLAVADKSTSKSSRLYHG